MPTTRGKGDNAPRARPDVNTRVVRTLLAAAAAVLIPACTEDNGLEAGQPSPDATALVPESTRMPAALTAPEPATTSPTPSDDAGSADEAAGSAIAAMERYLQTMNELSLDPSIALPELESVATDDALEWATYTVSTARDKDWTITGERTFDQIDVTRIQLDPTVSRSGHPAVHLDACLDSTAVDALDEDGDSVLPPARQTRLTTHWTVWRMDGTWVVAKTGFIGDEAEAAPCA